MQFNIRHVTRFIYESPISESVMEARVQPRSEGKQRCLQFALSTTPSSRVRMYQDHDGNVVHHFNIPGRISRLSIVAEALVESRPLPPLPDALPDAAWLEIDNAATSGTYWEWLNASPFARRTGALEAFGDELGLDRTADPLTTLRRLNEELFATLTYSPKSTRVDSPIDEALASRRGVCQDFTHIMIALVRRLGIPCRYVSGYLFHHGDDGVRSPEGSTHAWAEAWLPGLDWVGFDPTNKLLADHRHIRVAVGRDYADVPPTRGVFKGLSAVRSELAVSVRVGTTGASLLDQPPMMPWVSREIPSPLPGGDHGSLQQQQQQQQQ
jgi:transglutaminase-like putative cysteine protease